MPTKRSNALALASVLILHISGAASAQNLLVNSEFSTSTAPWTAQTPPPSGHDAAIALNPVIGRDTPPSLQVTLNPDASVARALSECIAIDPTQDYRFTAYGHADNAATVAKAHVLFHRDEVGPCDGTGTLYSTTATALDQGWVQLERDLPSWGLSPTAGHVRIVLEAGLSGPAGSPLQASFDHVQFGLQGTLPVELQTFHVD